LLVIALYVALIVGNVIHVGHAADDVDHRALFGISGVCDIEAADGPALAQSTDNDGPTCHTVGALRAPGRPLLGLASTPRSVVTLTAVCSTHLCVRSLDLAPPPLGRRLAMLQVLLT
jgi:hypothetical protein